MLNDLKKLFSRTWSAFHEELGRRDPEDEVAELLAAMRREMVEARATVPVLEEALEQARRELERERKALDDCHRRRALAQRIGDAETVRVAEEFAERHAARVGVLEEKLRAAQAERDLRVEEVSRMSRQYKETEANRFALLARLRTQRAQARMGVSSGDEPDPLAELDRESARADVEERLRELKRRMGQE